MTRLNVVLLVAVLASALYLVQTQYESRRLVSELDRARTEATKLAVDYQRLQVERRAQATPMRVEKMARDQLRMRSATPAITHYVRDPLAAAVAPRVPGAAEPAASGGGTP